MHRTEEAAEVGGAGIAAGWGVRAGGIVRALGMIGALVILPLIVPINIATEILIYGMFAMATNLLIGTAGLYSFGQAAFFGAGGYAAGYFLAHGWTSLPIALAVACVAGDSSTTSADRWARPNLELLEDRRGDLPELPVDSLGPATQLWLGRAARAAGVTPAHVFAPAISITSTLVGAARRVRASSSFSQPL